MDIIFGSVDAKQRQAEIEAEERAIEHDFGTPGELRAGGSNEGEREKEVREVDSVRSVMGKV